MFIYKILFASKVLQEIDLMIESSVTADYILGQVIYPVILTALYDRAKLLLNGKYRDHLEFFEFYVVLGLRRERLCRFKNIYTDELEVAHRFNTLLSQL